jgi:hypothetical protein
MKSHPRDEEQCLGLTTWSSGWIENKQREDQQGAFAGR